MSAFLKPACSLQGLFLYKRPQLQILSCGLQLRSVKTFNDLLIYKSQYGETIIEHPYAREDLSKMPLGYAFVQSKNLAIALRCRRLAQEHEQEIFACCTKSKFPRLFGLYVPSDIADSATYRFHERRKAEERKLRRSLSIAFPYMPFKHKIRFYTKRHERLQRLLKSSRKDEKSLELKIELYIMKYIKKKEGQLSRKEVKSVMGSWRDGSKMPKI
ncbi:hypothetical protein Forpe1208_v014243 [Fusarium oxysporum f. sp. rapae]|uniref:Uncharacterized protein n=1 Tax=Fusarium oxysporum f. sp. rapae TaxID=485398 RepID=A0A8J5NSB7_FUSOX|nr:hypothetical protein Forpe1208_v014243 [Fusarium oxysporum f. sp. rapae]